jgi:hypothetical protein
MSDFTQAAGRLSTSRKAGSTRSGVRPGASSVTDREDLIGNNDDGRERPPSSVPWRWLLAKLSTGAGRVRARARDSARSVIRSLLPRAVGWLRGKIRSPVRLIHSVFMATIGKDRGFGFWWLVVTVAISLIIGLLVAALLSPVIGILAALAVGIWMLIRRNRSSQSRKTAQAHLAS